MFKHRECGGIEDNDFIFSVETYATYINVSGFVVDADANRHMYYNDEEVYLYIVNSTQFTATNSWVTFGQLMPQEWAPRIEIQTIDLTGQGILKIDTSGNLKFKSLTGANVVLSAGLWAEFHYRLAQ